MAINFPTTLKANFPNWKFGLEWEVPQASVQGAETDFLHFIPMSWIEDNCPGDFWNNVESQDFHDVIIVEGDETTEIPRRIAIGSDLAGETGGIYVRRDIATAGNNLLYILWGNPSAPIVSEATQLSVFDQDFLGYYGLEEDATGAANEFFDYAGNFDLDDNTTATGKTGKVLRGQEFDGVNDIAIQDGIYSTYSPQTRGAVGCWFRVDAGASSETLVGFSGDGNTNKMQYWRLRDPGSGLVLQEFCRVKGTTSVSRNFLGTTIISTDVWNHVVFVQTNSGVRWYLNGVSETITSSEGSLLNTDWFDDWSSGNWNVGIGANPRNLANPLAGEIDEAFIHNATISAAYVKMMYDSQDDPDNFNQAGNCLVDCSITVNSCVPSVCSGGTYDLTVQVGYTNQPTTGTIDFTVNGQNYSRAITTTPQTEVISSIPCGQGGTVDVEFSDNVDCTDSCNYTPPPLPVCSLDIQSITPGACVGSTYSVSISIGYANYPAGTDLVVNCGVDSQTVSVTGSPQLVVFTGRSCGEGVVNVSANFTLDPTCSDSDTYTAPAENCSLSIASIIPSPCVGGQYSLTINVTYNADPGGNIIVDLDEGQYTFASSGSPQQMVIPGLTCGVGSGTANVYFDLDPGCGDIGSYTVPTDENPNQTVKIEIDGVEYSNFINWGELAIQLNLEDSEYFYTYPKTLSVWGDAYEYLNTQLNSSICTNPIIEISIKCIGETTWRLFSTAKADFLASSFNPCDCTAEIGLTDFSGAEQLRAQRGDIVSIPTNRIINGLYETENLCEYGGTIGGITVIDALQYIVDNLLGSGQVTVQSDFLTTDYQTARYFLDFPTLTGINNINAATISAFLSSDGNSFGDDIRANLGHGAGQSQTQESLLRKLCHNFNYSGNVYPANDYLVSPIARYEPTNAAEGFGEDRIIIEAHNPLDVSVTTATGTATVTQQRGNVYGAGNLVLNPNLSGSDTLDTSWGDIVELLKKLFGCGVFYSGDTITIEPMNAFYMNGLTAKTPFDLSGSYWGEYSIISDWAYDDIKIGAPPPLDTRQEERSSENWEGCQWLDPINGQTLDKFTSPLVIRKPGRFTFDGSFYLDGSAMLANATFDIVLTVDYSTSADDVLANPNISSEALYYRTLVSGFSLTTSDTDKAANFAQTTIDVGTGNVINVEFIATGVTDPLDLPRIVPGSTPTAAFFKVVNYCPDRPVSPESIYDSQGRTVDNRTFSPCPNGLIKDMGIPRQFNIGHGRKVGEDIGQGENGSGIYLFYIDTADNSIIRYEKPWYLDGNPAPGQPQPPSCTNDSSDFSSIGFSFYNAPLSTNHIFYYLAYANRLNFFRSYLRFVNNISRSGNNYRNTQSISRFNYFTFAYPPYVELGETPSKEYEIKADISDTDFSDIINKLRITANICGEDITGDVGTVLFNLADGQTTIKIRTN